MPRVTIKIVSDLLPVTIPPKALLESLAKYDSLPKYDKNHRRPGAHLEFPLPEELEKYQAFYYYPAPGEGGSGVIRDFHSGDKLYLFLTPEVYELQLREPTHHRGGEWLYKNKVMDVSGSKTVSKEELQLLIKHKVLREEKLLEKIKREVEAFENLDRIAPAKRERIPESVRLFVWQRDEGQCVKCGSREKLEFDHIIPISEGGSNTERNIQLLCETCNREKGKNL